ncbi:MAG: hypothetical protein NC177_09265 [Ruminococcus flavefaciens]|nr:hypothetical protein [Ruminococcus flavefaciens]
MRNFHNGFDIFEIIRKNKCEEYLYMSHEELFQKKLKIDEDVIKWKEDSQKAKHFPYEHFYPDPSYVYGFFLIESAVISIIINYKFHNLERLENLIFLKKDKPEIYETLINAIKKKPKISYIDLINLGTEKDEFEMYLEKLIEDGVISRRGKKYDRYWRTK